MLVEAKQMMPITRLQKKMFEQYEIKKMAETRMEKYNPNVNELFGMFNDGKLSSISS